MGDFPRPFSGNKTKKQKKDSKAKAGATSYGQANRLMNLAAETELMRRAVPKTRVFDFDDKLATKEAPRKKTKEMGGPNMETPLEKALIGKQKNLPQHLKDAIEAAPESPATMTGMPTAPIRPVNNVFSPQTQQVASQMYGEQIPGSYDRALPQGMYATPQEVIAAKTNSRMTQALSGAMSPFNNNHYDKKLIGENTDEIKKDKKGREYSLVMEDSKNFRKGDIIRPANNKTFKKSITTDGYIMGGDYEVDKRNRIINK